MSAMKPRDFPNERYSFHEYISKHRMLTYWHQINELLLLRPSSVLEIGIGPGVVTGYLRHIGIKVTTVDVNPRLSADYTGSVLELDSFLQPESFDVILCARVLHHLKYATFSMALKQLAFVARKGVLVTLPYNDFRLYFMFRYTSSDITTFALPLPLRLKRLFSRDERHRQEPRSSSFWKIDDSVDHSIREVRAVMSQYFDIKRAYRLPEDSAHYLIVLDKSQPLDAK